MLDQTIKTIRFVKNLRNFKNDQSEIGTEKAFAYLKEILGNDGGLLTKVLQYQGTNIDIESSQLGTDGISRDEILKILKDELGEKFKEIEDLSEQALSASVGQVHFAKYQGKEIAVKVQYPFIRKTFETQFKLLNLLPKATQLSPLKKWGMDFSSYQSTLKTLFENECNYTKERESLGEWSKYFSEIGDAKCPKTFPEISTKHVLVMEKLEGEYIDQVVNNWSVSEKKDLARKIFKTYFDLLFNKKVIQGDTNHGNFIFQKNDPSIQFIDLGQAFTVSEEIINALIYALKNKLVEKPLDSYSFLVHLGFDSEKLIPLLPKLDLMVDILLYPFLSPFALNIKEWNYKNELDLLLGEDKWWFRSAGSPDFFIFMKSFMGIKNLIRKLDQPVYFRGILQDLLKDLSVPKFKLISHAQTLSSHYSNQVRVLLLENNIEKVKLTIPFQAIFSLPEYFNDDTAKAISDRGIDLNEIVRSALQDGGKPKTFFELEFDNRKIELSLL